MSKKTNDNFMINYYNLNSIFRKNNNYNNYFPLKLYRREHIHIKIIKEFFFILLMHSRKH